MGRRRTKAAEQSEPAETHDTDTADRATMSQSSQRLDESWQLARVPMDVSASLFEANGLNWEMPGMDDLSRFFPYRTVSFSITDGAIGTVTRTLSTVHGASSAAAQVQGSSLSRPLAVEDVRSDWGGSYGFAVAFNAATPSTTWEYDDTHGLFANKNAHFPVIFSVTRAVPARANAHIRAFMRFTAAEYSRNPIGQCVLHIQSDQKQGVHPDSVGSFLRCDAPHARYVSDPAGHRSIIVPVPEGLTPQTEVFSFSCFSSCLGDRIRRHAQLVFALEVDDQIVASRAVNVRVCANPLRDLRQQIDGNAKGRKRSPKEGRVPDTPSTPLHSDAVSHGPPGFVSETHTISAALNPADATDDDDNRIYTISVRGRRNFEVVSRIVLGLNALDRELAVAQPAIAAPPPAQQPQPPAQTLPPLPPPPIASEPQRRPAEDDAGETALRAPKRRRLVAAPTQTSDTPRVSRRRRKAGAADEDKPRDAGAENDGGDTEVEDGDGSSSLDSANGTPIKTGLERPPLERTATLTRGGASVRDLLERLGMGGHVPSLERAGLLDWQRLRVARDGDLAAAGVTSPTDRARLLAALSVQGAPVQIIQYTVTRTVSTPRMVGVGHATHGERP